MFQLCNILSQFKVKEVSLLLAVMICHCMDGCDTEMLIFSDRIALSFILPSPL